MKTLLRIITIAGLLAAVVLAFQGMAIPKRTGRPVKTIETKLPPITVDFRDIAEEAGLTAVNVSGGREVKKYLLEATGTGVAIFDFDNDGRMDIFLVNATTFDPPAGIAAACVAARQPGSSAASIVPTGSPR